MFGEQTVSLVEHFTLSRFPNYKHCFSIVYVSFSMVSWCGKVVNAVLQTASASKHKLLCTSDVLFTVGVVCVVRKCGVNTPGYVVFFWLNFFWRKRKLRH